MSARLGIPQASHRPRQARRDLSWQEHAACTDANPRIFHDPDRYTDALIVCAPCPVKQQCRESRPHGDEGVWGGRVFSKRRVAS